MYLKISFKCIVVETFIGPHEDFLGRIYTCENVETKTSLSLIFRHNIQCEFRINI